jgi:tetratricopeptide (TPR) repeat protein
MGKTEWFRRTSWTEVDRLEFRVRLERSRSPFHKAQYLRIQAHHLECDADPPQVGAALELLEELLREYPEPSQVGEVHRQRGSCLAKLGHLEQALRSFQAALDAERRYPGVQGTAYLDYAEVVLQLGRSELYEDALACLGQRAEKTPFPITQYRSDVATAFLCERLGRTAEARAAATQALAAAAKTESPFRYHRRLGLVEDADPNVQGHLLRLAGRSA